MKYLPILIWILVATVASGAIYLVAPKDPVENLRDMISVELKSKCISEAQQHEFLTDSYSRKPKGFFSSIDENEYRPELPKEITLEEFKELKSDLLANRRTVPSQIEDVYLKASRVDTIEVWIYKFFNDRFEYLCEAHIEMDGDIPIPDWDLELKITRNERAR
jgi:hypothetical protein